MSNVLQNLNVHFSVLNFNEMRRLNSADNPEIPSYTEKRQTTTQDPCFRENVQVFLEVEVIESLYTAMSRENGNSMEQDGSVEITILRSERAEPFNHSPKNSSTLNIIEEQAKKTCSDLQYHAKPDRRLASSATDRHRIPYLDERQNKSFVFKNLKESPAINAGEIIGDNLHSEVRVTPQIIVPENNSIHRSLKVRHGDNCDPEISLVKNDEEAVAAEFRKSYINACDSESKLRKAQSCANPLVYQAHLNPGAQKNYPFVELSAAENILDAYGADDSSRCEVKHQIIESMQKALMEWASDEKRTADALYNDTSPFMRCEHCGVISFKKAQILVPTTRDKLSMKVEFKEKTAQLKSSLLSERNEATKDMLKVKKRVIEKEPEKSSEVKFDSAYSESERKLFMRERGVNGENICAPSFADTMTAEREHACISKNLITVANISQKNQSKTTPPFLTTNKIGRCFSVEKNENSNNTHLRNSYSTRYSPRQGISKPVKKPVRNTNCRDNSTRNNFEIGNNVTRFQRKNSIPLSKECEETKTSVYKNRKTDNNNSHNASAETKINPVAKLETLSPRNSWRKNKFGRSLVPPSNIPTKLDKTSSIRPLLTKNVAEHLVRVKSSAIEEQGTQSLLPSNSNETESQSKSDLWLWKNQTLLVKGIEKGLQDRRADLRDNERKNLLHPCTASSDDELSTDQADCLGNKRFSVSDNDQRSYRSTKNFKPHQIIPDFNFSTPLIGFGRGACGNEDFMIDRYLADNNSPLQYTEESETTAFSSSSSENVSREWAALLGQGHKVDCEPLSVKKNNESPFQAMRSIREQIDETFGICSNYPVVTREKLCSYENVDHISDTCMYLISDNEMKGKEFETRDDSKKCILTRHFDPFKVTTGFAANTFNASEKIGELKVITDKFRDDDNHDDHSVKDDASEKKDALKMTYKNLASVISSSSEYSGVEHRELDVQQSSLDNGNGGSVLQLNESETFERQITYDEMSSKDTSTTSKENLETRALPVYRKLLESKDQMDWESFQQLVGTLHPSQRELWSDICKAVSNEAKRIAGETGASTEVCIEVNPIPTSQIFPCEKISRVKSSGDEISFEMDMILTDSEIFLDQTTFYGPEKYQ